MKNELRSWEKEKKLIPIMITMYCKGNHKIERKKQCIGHSDTCTECKELIEYVLCRLETCPFKENKKFCSFCKVHCYKPEMRMKIKSVMRYSGPRMIFSHPIFAISHVTQMIKYKKLKTEIKENDR